MRQQRTSPARVCSKAFQSIKAFDSKGLVAPMDFSRPGQPPAREVMVLQPDPGVAGTLSGRSPAVRLQAGGRVRPRRLRRTDTTDVDPTSRLSEDRPCEARCRTSRSRSCTCFERAEQLFFDKEIVTETGTGRERTTYGEWARRTRCLGGGSTHSSVPEDARVATFAWNTARHLELYFAVPCSGRVVHTLNIRLFPEQLDLHHQPRGGRCDLRRPVAGRAAVATPRRMSRTVQHVVVMDDGPR